MIFLLYFTRLLFLDNSIRSTLSYGTTCSKLAITIFQLSIQILKITMHF